MAIKSASWIVMAIGRVICDLAVAAERGIAAQSPTTQAAREVQQLLCAGLDAVAKEVRGAVDFAIEEQIEHNS